MSYFLLVIAILSVSAAAPLVRLAEPLSPVWVAAGRVGLAALLLAALSGRRLGEVAGLGWPDKLRVGAAGLLLGVHFGVWIPSLYFTSTAASVALVATQPLFAGIFGWLVLREGLGRREIVGIAVAALGCGVLASGDLGASPSPPGSHPLLGDVLAVAGAASAAGYFVVGRRLRSAVSLLPYLAVVNAIAALGLFALALIVAPPVRGFATSDYLAVGIMALVCSVVGHTLLNESVRRVRVHLVALAILGEPVVSSLATWVFFSETPPPHAVAGGALILAGIYLGFAGRSP